MMVGRMCWLVMVVVVVVGPRIWLAHQRMDLEVIGAREVGGPVTRDVAPLDVVGLVEVLWRSWVGGRRRRRWGWAGTHRRRRG